MSFFKKKSTLEKATPPKDTSSPPHHWSIFEEGQLMVDMYETADTLVVRSFVAGVEPENLEISMHNDMLTIRGKRHDVEEIHDDRFFHRECYWGTFSRSVIIPRPVDVGAIQALFKNGVVTIILPKKDFSESSISVESEQ